MTLENILTPLTKCTRSFLLDTSDFIRLIKTQSSLSTMAILTTWDGMLATDRLLAEANIDPRVRNFCSDLLNLVLRDTYFMFQDTFYIQKRGTAMGSNVAPPYAVAYMAAFEEDFVFYHPLFVQHSKLWRRFIDDIFCIWDGPIETLLLFDSHINNIWHELKFTLQYSTENMSFLDTMIYKNTEGIVSIDLFTKATDRNSLLEYTSFHPPAVKKSIPISQFQRVNRIVTKEDTMNQRLDEIEEKFSNRGYPTKLLTTARHSTLKIETQRTVYPLDKLVQADIGSSVRIPKQIILRTQRPGTFPCLNCLQCNNIKKGDNFFHPHTGQSYPVRGFLTCESTYVVYMIKCPCGLAYIGETTEAIRDRISQNKSNIRCNRDHLPLPHHFQSRGHHVSQLRFQVLEQIDASRRGQNRIKLLKKREAFWIFTLQNLEPRGLNRDYDTSSFLRSLQF
ncbi:unnamed protein product, partial [Ranitomeya imitator]